MSHAAAALTRLRRPRLLIRAARFGLAEYDRGRALRRILPDRAEDASPLPPLIAREAEFEERRVSGDAAYSVARHVEVLIALMGEAQSVLRAHAPQ